MSDEDFLKLSEPTAPSTEAPVETVVQPPVEETPVTNEAPEADGDVAPEGPTDTEAPADVEASSEETGDQEAPPGEPEPGDAEGETPEPAPAEGVASAPDYEAFYKQIMTPFKANGKTIELKDPKEAISLMQMGANYTRKMQALQPHRKLMMMLEDNDLLDPGKLSYLIDLEKKNPEAIKKLIKDSGIDVLDVDTSEEPKYQAGNHTVSDEEARFRTAIEEVSSQPQGPETIALINSQWDATSKEFLWKNPDVLSVIREQHENGIYARITAEMDRQITLGVLPSETPFMQAYKAVGDELMAKNAFGGLGHQEPQVPLDTRPAVPKATVGNGAQVRAATPPPNTTRKASAPVNYLAMPDDEFLKVMNGRV
jgi:hypothetical protein